MKFKYRVEYPTKITAVGETENGFIFTGEARCHSNEQFDVKKGKQIARLRAQQKQLKKIREKVDEEVGELNKELNILMEKLNRKHKRLRINNQKLLEIKKELGELND